MKLPFRAILMAVVGLPGLVSANLNLWENRGNIITATNVNATNVINYGTIQAPVVFFNLHNFTNRGTMQNGIPLTGIVGDTGVVGGAGLYDVPGFRFDNAPANSSGQIFAPRRPASSFHNFSGRTIAVFDGLVYKDILLPPFRASKLEVQATDIVNRGLLQAGSGGLIRLIGTNINLYRGTHEITGLPGSGPGNNHDDGVFTASLAIFDNYWGQAEDEFRIDNRYFLDDDGAVEIVSSPIHEVNTGNVAGPQFQNFFGLLESPVTAAFEVVVDEIEIEVRDQAGQVSQQMFRSNVVRQVVFAMTSDSERFPISIYATPGSDPENFMRTITVQYAYSRTNFATGRPITNYIVFTDTLAAEDFRGTLENGLDGTERPANYELYRSATGVSVEVPFGDFPLTNGFLYGPDFEDWQIDGQFAGYSATLDTLTERPTPITAGTVTNSLGRIEIFANTLDMENARLTAEGAVIIKANHLISTTNAVVDAEFLSYDLAKTSGTLHIQGLSKLTTDRLRGTITAWSGLWENTFNEVIENFDEDGVLDPITNAIAMTFHMLIVDARQLTPIQAATVHRLNLKAEDEVVIHDAANIDGYFRVDAKSLTLNNDLWLLGGISDWDRGITPVLRSFTNSGYLYIPNTASFGADGPLNYLAFVNRGLIQSFGQHINSDYVEVSGGTNFSSADLNIQSQTSLFSTALLNANGDLTVRANDLSLLDQSQLYAEYHLTLDVANSLTDSGPGFLNWVMAADGFSLVRKPPTCDLLGTAFVSYALPFAQVWHFWAGEDWGATAAGFVNNAAIGSLILSPDGFDPLFTFAGTTAGNHALYVEHLDLSLLEDYANHLEILPGFTIYYASASLSFTNSAEEFLDGQFGGRLRWVPDFVGSASSATVQINGGQTIEVNVGVAYSYTLDSDADGIVNALDDSPFDGVTITGIEPTTNPAGFKITWNAAPNTLYRLESSTNMLADSWKVVLSTTSTNSAVGPWSAVDANTSGVPQYYRVTYSPFGQ
jgi:hypothetical protein